MARFTEITSSTAKSFLTGGSWTSFNPSFSAASFDGIKFQTGGQNFYLRYRTCNKGYGWYPFVTSKVTDYAGSSGKNAEAIQIQVYDNAGNKLDKKYIVMYRTYAEYRWLAWVSNATPDRMQMIKDQFGLGGTIDLTSWNSGLPGDGMPISRCEIRIFEEDTSSGSTPPAKMREIMDREKLTGTLDTASGYAGIIGTSATKLEIRFYQSNF